MNIFKFIHPSPIIIAGPTGCGKTSFIQKMISEKLIDPFPSRILYFYSEWQDCYDKLKNFYNIEFFEGIPSFSYLENVSNSLLIFDDLFSESKDNEILLNIFTKWSHHRKLTVILVTQNIFSKGNILRTLNLNAHYIVLFNNPRDKTQISFLSRQMYPRNSKFLIEAYDDACNLPYGYLLVDLKQETKKEERVLTGIFKKEITIFYNEF